MKGRTRSMVVAALLTLSLLLVAGGRAARADALDEAWKRGNAAALRGDDAAAIAAYEELEHHGVISGDLAFNLGNAYLRRGELGRAVWSYERALALDPEDDDARYNLAQARKLGREKTEDKLEGAERDPLWMRAAEALAPATATWLFVGLYLAFFALLFARRWSRRRAAGEAAPGAWGPLGVSAALVGAGAALAAALLLGRVALDRLSFGVILPDAVAVKEGADVNDRTTFDVHAGLRVRLLDEDQGWIRVRLANGLEGWVPAGDVGRL